MPIAHAAAALLGGEAVPAEPLGGGCLEQVTRVTLGDGRRVVAKGGPAPRVEAAMLEAVRAAGAPAPCVLAVDDTMLVMEERPRRGAPADAWADLGRVLATLHAAEGARYGWDADYAYGPVALPNAATDDWPGFWAERRLLAHADRLPAAFARRVAALVADLSGRLPAHPRPALLHGDLWGGNVLVEGDRVSALIDPACYHGHAEVDLAMGRGLPHPARAERALRRAPGSPRARAAAIRGAAPPEPPHLCLPVRAGAVVGRRGGFGRGHEVAKYRWVVAGRGPAVTPRAAA